MAVEQILHMNGGEGDASYANNSTFQVMNLSTMLQLINSSTILAIFL